MITLDKVSKTYPSGQVAVSSLTLEIATGEVCMLVGPSGCGKTTTLKMINRLVQPTGGRILIDGRDVLDEDPVRLRLGIGYVIQQVGLFPHQTIGQNVATVPHLLGWDRKRTEARVHELLDLVGLDPRKYSKRFPAQLSGGQRQRVGVARALGGDPPILLMDEPFGAVDRLAREHLQQEFHAIQRQMRKTVVFVTHDIDEAVRLGDKIAILSEGGRLQQYDSPLRILAAPANDFVTEFLGPDRGEKRLEVTPIDPAKLEPGIGTGLPSVAATATIGDALAKMLLANSDRVRVESEGRPLGILSAAGIFGGRSKAK